MLKSFTRVAGFKAALCLGIGLSALSVYAAPAMAQEQAAEDEQARTLDTVTITATKREQTLQDVPVAVSVVDDSVIERAAIVDLNDLQSIVPALSVGQLQSSANTNFVIRGFGNGANNAGIEPSVGVFIDGVYRSRSGAQISDLPNIERVEVLRGPQSTLFGKNASAGVISIVTKRPRFEPSGLVDATLSNENGYRFNGYITGPMAENLALALSATYNTRDGYVTDLGFGPDQNDRDRWGVRADFLLEPTENMSFRLMADYDRINEICCAAVNVINGPTGAVINAIGGNLVPQDPFSYTAFYNFGSTNKIDNNGVSLQGDIDFGRFRLTSITAFRQSQLKTNQDSDFTSADLIGLNANETDIETLTQEIRLASTGGERFDWMIGGFYFDESVAIENDFKYGRDFRRYVNILSSGALNTLEGALGLPVGRAFGQTGQGPRESFGQDNQAYSLFGTVDLYVTDRLTATVGLNYTTDEKSAYGRATNTDVFSGLSLTQVGYNLVLSNILAANGVNINNPAQVGAFITANPATFAAIQQQSLAIARNFNPATPANTRNPLAGLRPLQFLPPFLAFPNAVENGQSSDSETTYTLRLAYDLTDNINVYGSYATGFKATSWNLSRDSRPFPADFVAGNEPVRDPITNQLFPGPNSPIRNAGLAVPNLTSGTRFAGPETSKVFEIGLKAAYRDLAFNIALFDQTIEGFQQNVFTGTGFALANAGELSNRGIEVDVSWNATDALLLTFAGTYQDPLYDSFVNSASGDLSGTTPSGIPDLTTSTSGTYFFRLAGLDSFVRADWQYESESAYFDDPANQALIGRKRSVNLVNASTGFTTAGGFGLTLWARNLFEDEFITTAFPSVAQAGSISGYPNQPRTYGVTLQKTF